MASMVLLNSACNPVFYVRRFSELKYHMKRLLCFWNKDMVEHIDRKYNRQPLTTYKQFTHLFEKILSRFLLLFKMCLAVSADNFGIFNI